MLRDAQSPSKESPRPLPLAPHGEREPEFYVLFCIFTPHPKTLVLHPFPTLTFQLHQPLSAPPLRVLPPGTPGVQAAPCPHSSVPCPQPQPLPQRTPLISAPATPTPVSQAHKARNFSSLSLDTVNPSTTLKIHRCLPLTKEARLLPHSPWTQSQSQQMAQV